MRVPAAARAAGTHQIRVGTDIENSSLRPDDPAARAECGPCRRLGGAHGRLRRLRRSNRRTTSKSTLTSRITGILAPHADVRSRSAHAMEPRDRHHASGAAAGRWRGRRSSPGALKFSAGWGVYYDPVTLALLALATEQTSLTTFYAPDGTPHRDADGDRCTSSNTRDLRTPRFTVASVSAEKRSALEVSSAAWISCRRQGSRGFAFDQVTAGPLLERIHRGQLAARELQRGGVRAAPDVLREVPVVRQLHAIERDHERGRAVFDREPDPDASVGRPAALERAQSLPDVGLGSGGKERGSRRCCARSWATRISRCWPNTTPGFRSALPVRTAILRALRIVAVSRLTFLSISRLSGSSISTDTFGRWRAGVVNVLDRANPNVVNSDFDSPQFMLFGRGQARAVNVRLRFLGRK